MTEGLFYRHQFCTDFEEYCHNVREWDLDYRPLESGPFLSERLSFGSNDFIFSHTKIGRRLLQRGSIPPGLVTFGILASPDIKIHWRNIDIAGDSLIIFPPGGELYSITQADFNVFPISLSEQKLNQVCTMLELPDFRTLTKKSESFSCFPQRLFEFRRYLEYVEAHLRTGAGSDRNNHFLREIEHEITVKLVRILAEHSLPARGKRVRRRDAAIKIAESYIRENSHKWITIPELCREANASQRMLEYAFRERYKMTPKAYLRAVQLNTVRKQLLKASPFTNQVNRIARQNGFSHMGQFSAGYKNLFGERPSDTLRHSQ